MKKLSTMIAGLIACAGLLPGLAQAHTHLETSMPAEGAALDAPPRHLMLHFSEPTRLTALSIQKEGGADEVNVDGLPKKPSAVLTLPLAPLPPGKYTVQWRAIGGDRHVMSGALHFTIQAR